LDDVGTHCTEDGMQTCEGARMKVGGAFEVMYIDAGVLQTLELRAPGPSIDGDDNGAELGWIERFSEVHEHGLRTPASDAVSEVQHDGAAITHRGRKRARGHESTHGLPEGQVERVSRAKRGRLHIMDMAFR
jgi:hypothetical protein